MEDRGGIIRARQAPVGHQPGQGSFGVEPLGFGVSEGGEERPLHDLRHTGNTWAAATGASTRELMARMGHANSAAALRYQHATAARDRAIAIALSALAEPPKETPDR